MDGFIESNLDELEDDEEGVSGKWKNEKKSSVFEPVRPVEAFHN